MNRNRHLSIKNYGERHTQPHMPFFRATKKKPKFRTKVKNFIKKVFRKRG